MSALANLIGHLEIAGKPKKDLAAAIGIKSSGWSERLKYPGRFKVKDLDGIAAVLGTTPEELLRPVPRSYPRSPLLPDEL